MIEIFGINLLELLIYLIPSLFTSIIVLIIFFRYRDRGKVKLMVLKPTGQYKDRTVKVLDNNKLKIGDSTPNFSPLNFFEEDLKPIIFWRRPRRKLLWVEGMAKVLSFKELKDDVGELQWWWTNKEVRQYIKKEIAKAKMEVKPISRIEFVVILAFLIVIIVLLLLNLQQGRLFQ
jgi:hypothetical protein